MNNAVYATFLEQARIAFLSPYEAHVENMILARLEIDFRSQLRQVRHASPAVRSLPASERSPCCWRVATATGS